MNILSDVLTKKVSKVLLITNDSDISPAVKLSLSHDPKIFFRIITPPMSQQDVKSNRYAFELLQSAKQLHPINIRINQLMQCQLPDPYITKKGKNIPKPLKYK